MSMAQELRTAKIDVNCYAGARSALRGIIPSSRKPLKLGMDQPPVPMRMQLP